MPILLPEEHPQTHTLILVDVDCTQLRQQQTHARSVLGRGADPLHQPYVASHCYRSFAIAKARSMSRFCFYPRCCLLHEFEQRMSRHEVLLLRSFLDELDHAEPSLQAYLFDRSAAAGALSSYHQPSQESPDRQHLHHQQQKLEHRTAQQQSRACWTADSLRNKLTELSTLQVSDERPQPGTKNTTAIPGGPFTAPATPPGLVYSAIDALVRFVTRLLPLVDHGVVGAAESSQTFPPPEQLRRQQARSGAVATPSLQEYSPSALAKALIDLALLCLANLLESPSWRHVFFGVLHEVQREQQQQHLRSGSGGGKPSDGFSSRTTLQEYLWRRIVAADAPPPGNDGGNAAKSGVNPTPSSSPSSALPRSLPVADQAAVRLCCSMVRHCPLSFPASSYASLAPHLADYLLGSDTGNNSEEVERPRNGLMVLLDLFAACARGSPHFRQYVKGLRRKRELFRRLLGFLGPRCDGRIVVRALCALTRVLASDPLEGKVRRSVFRLVLGVGRS